MNNPVRSRIRAASPVNPEKKIVDRVILLTIILSGLWIIFAPGRGILHYRQVQRNIDTLSHETQNLTKQNIVLQKEIAMLQNDLGHIEELARKKYGLLKPDERLYIFNGEK